jgi:hypothetical protein
MPSRARPGACRGVGQRASALISSRRCTRKPGGAAPQALKANPERAPIDLKVNANYITRFGQARGPRRAGGGRAGAPPCMLSRAPGHARLPPASCGGQAARFGSDAWRGPRALSALAAAPGACWRWQPCRSVHEGSSAGTGWHRRRPRSPSPAASGRRGAGGARAASRRRTAACLLAPSLCLESLNLTLPAAGGAHRGPGPGVRDGGRAGDRHHILSARRAARRTAARTDGGPVARRRQVRRCLLSAPGSVGLRAGGGCVSGEGALAVPDLRMLSWDV